ncbi:MAG TPA: glycosyltransferase family 9 protein [Candidatus Omnitrophota bacterium]|nr:glycosyltransferase family 9 protein [Candidatus Omnitrophota bacterium]HPD85585.1 glycosyltransferase family 9 protein [Candidatus Omnitrophota bacterium]HRZ04375.1 glycosyltransferase family 9 protein [Candidatus Omnitrophota bacterium]
MHNRRKVLVIKTGFSEFLDREISTTISLGDVLICTSILHLYKNDRVTWITSFKGSPLLKDNPYIDEILIFGPETLKKITRRSFDILVNLEKDIGICTYLAQIKAKKKYGFYFNSRIYDIATYKRSTQYLLTGQENHRYIHKNAFELLFETLGGRWKGQSPVLGRKRGNREKYDIGFNFAVGPKWPTKAWPMKYWKELEGILKKDYSLSWQQGHKNVAKYIDWIESCRVIVTSDSLGQILAQALGKKVISLYGPTNYLRMTGIDNIHIVASTLNCPFAPCYSPICKFDRFCMNYISPKTVARECARLLNKKASSRERT